VRHHVIAKDRIDATDLHDVVAHNIAVINVQASTALHLMDRHPERARSALGVLRAADESAPREPSATLARLGDLARNAAAAGLAVEVEQEGEDLPLPAGASLAAQGPAAASMTMAALAGVALLCYGAALYLLPGPAAAGPAPER
jgi:hypothetical protein